MSGIWTLTPREREDRWSGVVAATHDMTTEELIDCIAIGGKLSILSCVERGGMTLRDAATAVAHELMVRGGQRQ